MTSNDAVLELATLPTEQPSPIPTHLRDALQDTGAASYVSEPHWANDDRIAHGQKPLTQVYLFLDEHGKGLISQETICEGHFYRPGQD